MLLSLYCIFLGCIWYRTLAYECCNKVELIFASFICMFYVREKMNWMDVVVQESNLGDWNRTFWETSRYEPDRKVYQYTPCVSAIRVHSTRSKTKKYIYPSIHPFIHPSQFQITLLFGIIFGPLLGHLFKLLGFILQLIGNFLFEWMVRLRRLQQTVHHRETMLRIQSWPPGSQDVAADFATFGLDRGMVDFSLKDQLGWLEGVLGGKFQQQDKLSSSVGRSGGSVNGAMPFEQVILDNVNPRNVAEGFVFFQFGTFLNCAEVELVGAFRSSSSSSSSI